MIDYSQTLRTIAIIETKFREWAPIAGNADSVATNTIAVVPFRVANVNVADIEGMQSTMILALDTTSGAGRYLTGGDIPTASHGIPFPSGGGVFTVRGYQTISTFALIATSGTTIPFSLQLYRRAFT